MPCCFLCGLLRLWQGCARGFSFGVLRIFEKHGDAGVCDGFVFITGCLGAHVGCLPAVYHAGQLERYFEKLVLILRKLLLCNEATECRICRMPVRVAFLPPRRLTFCSFP